jgi:hypothetical protein
MPLARILTINPEGAAAFSLELQQMGFQVEVVNPNDQYLCPADLEIELAICDQQQVLGRAAAIAAQLQAEVVVFPGAIPPLPRPVAAELASEPADLTEVEASADVPGTIMEIPIQRQPEPVSHLMESALSTSAQEEAAGPTASAFSALAERLRNRLQQFRSAVASGLARLTTAASSTGSTVAGQARDLQERLRLSLAQAHAAREQRLAERKKLQLEAAQRASELERKRRKELEVAAAARQVELQRVQAEKEKRFAEMERVRVEASEQAAALERARLAVQAQDVQDQDKDAKDRDRDQPSQYQKPPRPARQKPAQAAGARKGQLRGAFAGAVAASFLFLVGMVLANFRSIIPLSRSLTNGSVEQQVPFGPTTVHGTPGVTVGGTSTPKPVRAVATRPQETTQQVKPHPGQNSKPVTQQKSQWHHFQRSTREDDAGTADDVVVRHYAAPRKPVQAAQQQARLKRYSDE